jgi:hypothetical protein
MKFDRWMRMEAGNFRPSLFPPALRTWNKYIEPISGNAEISPSSSFVFESYLLGNVHY